jgi:hypothetical protein
MGYFLHIPGKSQGNRVTQIVHGIRDDGKAIGKRSPDKLNNGKRQIQQKSDGNVGLTAVVMAVVMMVRMCIQKMLPVDLVVNFIFHHVEMVNI